MFDLIQNHVFPFGRREDYPTQDAYDNAWLGWRDEDFAIGSSDAASICSVAPPSWDSRMQLSLRKRGKIPRKPTNNMMIVGHLMEHVTSELYRLRTNCEWAGEQIPCEHPDRPWMRATLDRLTSTGKIVELKFASRYTPHRFGEDGDSDSLPKAFVVQGQHQMDVYGAMELDVVVFTEGEIRVYPLRRNQEMIDAIVGLETAFRDDMIADIDPEELVASDASVLAGMFTECEGMIDLDERDVAAAETYDEMSKLIKQAEDRKKKAKARLIQSFGNMKYGSCPDGRTVVRSHWITEASTIERSSFPNTKFSIKKARAS